MTKSAETTELLAAVDALLAAIEAARAELDAPGALPDWLIAGLADAGVLRMTLPRSLGGLEADPFVTLDVLERLSWADGGVGWVAAIAAATAGFVASRVPHEVAASIWSDPKIVVCGTIGVPAGVATPVDGGHRVSVQREGGRSRGRRGGCAADTARGRDADPRLPAAAQLGCRRAARHRQHRLRDR
jgi:hypothetical protein